MGQGEDDVEVRDRQELCATFFEPALLGHGLTLRTVAIPTGVVDSPSNAAVVAALDVPTKGRRATTYDGVQRLQLLAGACVRFAMQRTEVADDVRELELPSSP